MGEGEEAPSWVRHSLLSMYRLFPNVLFASTSNLHADRNWMGDKTPVFAVFQATQSSVRETVFSSPTRGRAIHLVMHL